LLSCCFKIAVAKRTFVAYIKKHNTEVFMSQLSDRTLYLIEAAVFMILGLTAIAIPGLFTLSVELILGIVILLGGIYQLYRMWHQRHTERFWPALFSAAINIALGLVFLFKPLAGIISLTILLIAYFFASGVIQLIWTWQLRHVPQWGWLLLSGMLSILMGVLLVSGWPGSIIWSIGLLFGINLLFNGMALWNMAWNMPRNIDQPPGTDFIPPRV
jgi:uncharacterized membrane protein HdeD (DUF308 family)